MDSDVGHLGLAPSHPVKRRLAAGRCQGSRTWLTLDGSIRTTAVLTDQQLNELTSKPAPTQTVQSWAPPHRTELPGKHEQ